MESRGELIRGNDERIYVSVRVRPLNAKEISGSDVSDWECINDKTIVYKNVGLLASERSMYPTAYSFDRVFQTDCSTREVYEQGAKDVAISVVNGINSSIFAYGQTSSGKTYTMTGITEYAIADIYDHVQKHPERNYTLKFSAMEIYNESVRDLLSEDSSPLRLLDDPERGPIVEKLSEKILRDWNHVTQLLSICEAQRQIGETSLNETSSRSHQIIRLTVESSSREFIGRDNLSTLTATVNFVDLAGSERASQSLSVGTRLKEGCHINRSLLTLGTVVRKLSNGQHGHIPYRDSKLTRILQTSLGGNARTAIICTMSPARSHVEQSRNTLHFASCAKEITTNAKVNVVMSDKALVKCLQRELARLESELRNPESNFIPSNFSELLREKDLQIEKLEKEIKDLMLQRDIAQSQARDLLRMLGDDASSTMQGGLGHYPHLRVQKSPEAESPKQDTSILANQDADTRPCPDGYSRTSSEDLLPKVPYFDENFARNASPRVLLSSSSSARESDSSYSGWAGIDKLSDGTSEDLCREVHCVESESPSNRGIRVSNHLSYDETTDLNGDGQDNELASPPPLAEAEEFISSQPKDGNEIKEDIAKELAVIESKESSSLMFEKERQFKSTDYLDILSLEKLSLSHDNEDPFGVKSLKFSRSKSCKASIVADSGSPWIKMMKCSENTPSLGSEKECEGLGRQMYPFNLGSSVERSLRKEDCESPLEDAVDIEVDTTPDVKLTVEDNICSTSEVKGKDELPVEPEITENPEKEIKTKADESPKKNVKDVGLDPIEDELKGLSSWPVEFKRLQKEIIELWHACNVSLVHRTYFFLLFQGDTSDAIYLEVEMRRIKFLKDKFDRGEKTVVNGKQQTLASSTKALRQERRMLSEQMMKKFSEKEREGLFLKWGIGLKTKYRRLQLANRLWSNTEDMNHIEESAFLVAKLVGFIEPGQAPNKEMFGLNFVPRSSSRISTFKRSLVSLL